MFNLLAWSFLNDARNGITVKEEKQEYFRYVGMYKKQYKSLLRHKEIRLTPETTTDIIDWLQSLKSPEVEVKDWFDYVEKRVKEILNNLGLPDEHMKLYQVVKEYKSGPEWYAYKILLQLIITRHAMDKGDLFTSTLEAMRLQQAVGDLRFCHFEKYMITAMEDHKKKQKGGSAGNSSKGIDQAIRNIKKQSPDIKAKECWFELVNRAQNETVVTVDGINYILGAEQLNPADLTEVRVFSINDSTGKPDGKGIALGRLQNKFKDI